MSTLTIEQMKSNARVYDKIKPITFRQRLALHGYAKQNQRIAILWSV